MRGHLAVLIVFLGIPLLALAQGVPLVPCAGVECDACDIIALADNIVDFLIAIGSVIAAIIIALAGLTMVVSAGDTSRLQAARGRIYNAFVGLLIVLVAWLLVDTVMKTLVDSEKLGRPWNQIECAPEQTHSITPNIAPEDQSNQERPRPDAATTTPLAPSLPQERPAAIDPRVRADIQRAFADNTYAEQICDALERRNVPAHHCAHLQAIMVVESGGDDRAVSPRNAVGLMQILPSTARMLDPSLQGLNDTQVRQRLFSSQYNIDIAAEYYRRAHETFDGNQMLISAAYNGGFGANGPSHDCPGLFRWQCRWDQPGCHNTGHTHCTPNTGYVETRNYVAKVAKYTDALNELSAETSQ